MARPAAKARISERAWYQFPNNPNRSQRPIIPPKASIPVVMLERPVPRIRTPNKAKLIRLKRLVALTVSAPEKKWAKSRATGTPAATILTDQSVTKFDQKSPDCLSERPVILRMRINPNS